MLDPEGRAVAAGHSSAGAAHFFALARFDGAGALDASFGVQGVVLTDFPGATVARATALARQADGKLVVAGIACAGGSGPQCSGGTVAARARPLRRDAAAPGSRPGGGPSAAGRHPPRRAVRAALPVEPARATRPGGRRCACAAARPGAAAASSALRRLRTGRRSLLLGSRTSSIRAARGAPSW